MPASDNPTHPDPALAGISALTGTCTNKEAVPNVDQWQKAMMLLSLVGIEGMTECLACGDWMPNIEGKQCPACGCNWVAF